FATLCLLLHRRLFGRCLLCLFDLDFRADRQHLADREPARSGDVLRTAQALEALDGRLQHVCRIRRAEALGEDVADAAELEHGTDAAAGDHAGSLAGRAEHDARSAEPAHDLVGDGRPVLRDREEVLLRIVDGLRDRERDLARLPVAEADAVDLVADHDERGEREPPAALDHLRDAVDLDDALLELAGLFPGDDFAFDRCGAQNLSPPSRAASASAFTRPWYW